MPAESKPESTGRMMVCRGTGWVVGNMFKIVSYTMAYPKREKQSPFASYCLVNNKQFDSIVWG